MKTKYCPECILPLVKENRKFGRGSKLLKCPKCGYREPEYSYYYDKLDEENTKQALENMNSKIDYDKTN